MPMMPLNELARYFPGVLDLPGRLAPRSITEYRRDAEYFLRWCDFDAARVRDPAAFKARIAWMTTCEQEFSPYTINRRMVALKTLARRAAAVNGFDAAAAFRFSRSSLPRSQRCARDLPPCISSARSSCGPSAWRPMRGHS